MKLRILISAAALVACAVVVAAGCGGQDRADADSAAPATDSTASASGTPVHVERVRRQDLEEVVSAPGRTMAVREERVRAPFAGTLVSLEVSDGERVSRGQRIGALTARSSMAALTGARAMVEAAETPSEKADARRALELARQQLVERPLRASSDGTVTSHAAVQGDVLAEGDEVVTIAANDGIRFEAQVSQADLPGVREGQEARISLVADSAAWSGRVETILPVASTASLSIPVRIGSDGARVAWPARTGLFGQVEIVVGTRRNAVVVPTAAVLRDDISGTKRVAIAGADHLLHWREVATGISRGGLTEITSPELTTDQDVITSGHVGLPDGAPVRLLP
ncbi:MAG: efflux RND transporter periplasmic adaptor subunit [Gemmatimonadales bacterium]|jgi:RND family efflux transporter MFP subunit